MALVAALKLLYPVASPRIRRGSLMPRNNRARRLPLSSHLLRSFFRSFLALARGGVAEVTSVLT